MPTLGWRWLLALSSLPSSLLLLFYGMTPESPRYLCLKGRTEDTLHLLEKVARMNRTQLPPGVLVPDHQIELNGNWVLSEDTRMLPPRTDEVPPSDSVKHKLGAISSLVMLLSPRLIRSTLLLWMVFFGNAFSYYGLVLLTSELSTRRTECFPAKLLLEKPHDDVGYRDIFLASFAGKMKFFIWEESSFLVRMYLTDNLLFVWRVPWASFISYGSWQARS